MFCLLPDGPPVSHWCEYVCFQRGVWRVCMLHMIRKSHISHAVCLYREEFTGSLSLTPSALVSASSSSPSSCALASPSSMVSHLTALIFTINSFNHVTPFLIISVTDLLYGKFVCFPAFYFLNRTLIIFFYILFSWLNDEYFFNDLPCIWLFVCFFLICFLLGVNQFCQDILDMIRHCPPWCGKVLIYFKACWVFCTPFLLLVSLHLNWYRYWLLVDNNSTGDG